MFILAFVSMITYAQSLTVTGKVPVVFVSLSLDLCQKKDYAKNE